MRRVTVSDSGFAFGDLFTTYGDVAVVLAYALLVGSGALTGVLTGPLRVLLAGPLLFFLPGYALVSALFPARAPTETGDAGTSTRATAVTAALRRPGLEWVERAAMSVGASLVVLPLVALALSVLGVGYAPTPVVSAVVLVTGVGVLAGAVRRLQLPPSERFVLPVDRWHSELRAATVDADRSVDAALNVALALALVVALSSVAFGLAAPQRGESFTEVAVLTEQGGDLVASGYPANVTEGEPTNFTLTVENREGERTNYTAVVVLERVETSGTSVTVLERSELERVSLSVPDGETRRQQLTVRPDLIGEDLRLLVLVYEGDVPAETAPATADNYLRLWLDVQPAPGNATALAATAG